MAMKRKHKRLTFVVIALALLGFAIGLFLYGIRDSVSLFQTPTDIVNKQPGPDRRIRLGGLVEVDSVVRHEGSAMVQFVVTDLQNTVPVTYEGLLPDLFREGQGIVAEGRMKDGVFVATEVLAKHDEKYMPPEVADALKKSGQWKGGDGAAQPATGVMGK
jgi:cytochrome c-type biogenesis protein CcmE